MYWQLSNRADPRARVIADRHYNRQKPGTPQFVPPGRCLVLVIPDCAFWVTSWPFAEYTKHAWAGAWVCSAFRNERPDLYKSSELIRQAVSATRWRWPDVPDLGMITFVDEKKVAKGNPGYCYKVAGFSSSTPKRTKGGLLSFQMLPFSMPSAMEPLASTIPTNTTEDK